MQLDAVERAILAGEHGETRQQMMELLVALGKVFGAERMVPIASAQVSGASYKTIGEWGLRWLRSLDGRVAVPTVLNPVGMPREGWRDLGISPEFAAHQNAVLDAYRKLGVRLECTCTPYYLVRLQYGQHLAWAESSAVAYANSVIGARTNREGGPSALAAAIVGRTPFYGLHDMKNRAPSVMLDVEGAGVAGPMPAVHYGALGYLAGRLAGNRIPFFRGIRPTREEMKALGAAMAATGAVALFHVEGITPDARIFPYDLPALERIPVTREEVAGVLKAAPVDAVALGCPHCGPEELQQIASLLRGKIVRKPLFVFAAASVMERDPETVLAIRRTGAKVVADTCMVVSPLMEGYRAIMVDSGKALAYVPSMCGAMARLGTREECLREALTEPQG
ncbi:MAG: aconitase X catalytic domain-containing protein [Methanomicrobiales archaeon]|nr:aconitase X catalytic domain-containing protein [Methanomicrobiales archaeon]